MRSTKASAAVERLRTRSGDPLYSLSLQGDGRFVLRLAAPGGAAQTVGGPLPLEEFVAFVDGLFPRQKKPASKLDTAFRKQLEKR